MQAVVSRAASRPLWLPGSTAPKHLDGTLPADYGFDPLNLGAEPETLKWYIQSEIIHCRVAMTAVAGILIPGAIIPGIAQWYEAGEKALSGSPFPYSTLVAIEILLVNFVEVKRWMDIRKPGSQGEPGAFLGLEGMFKGTDQVGYPGGIFNPMGMGKDNMKEMQTKVRNAPAAGLMLWLALPGTTAVPPPALSFTFCVASAPPWAVA
jgi:hypothetical protein